MRGCSILYHGRINGIKLFLVRMLHINIWLAVPYFKAYVCIAGNFIQFQCINGLSYDEILYFADGQGSTQYVCDQLLFVDPIILIDLVVHHHGIAVDQYPCAFNAKHIDRYPYQ